MGVGINTSEKWHLGVFSLGVCIFRTNGALRKAEDGKECVCVSGAARCLVFNVWCSCKILHKNSKKRPSSDDILFLCGLAHHTSRTKRPRLGMGPHAPLLAVHFARPGRWTLECRNAGRLANKHHHKSNGLCWRTKGQGERLDTHTGGVDCLDLQHRVSTSCRSLPWHHLFA